MARYCRHENIINDLRYQNTMWQEKHIRQERIDDFLDSENFLDMIFGLARHYRTLNYLRKNIAPNYNHSFHYRDDGSLLGLIRVYDLQLVDGTHASLLGPVAVHPDKQNNGLGSFLIKYTLDRLDKKTATNHLVFLVGNFDYYKRHGFCKLNNHDDKEQYNFDGPVAPLSLLVRCDDKQEILKHGGKLDFVNKR